MKDFIELPVAIYDGYKAQIDELLAKYDITLEMYPERTENNACARNYKDKLTIECWGVYARPNNLETIITILHELGHLLDSMNFDNGRDYIAFYGVETTELLAWCHAFELAIELGFSLDHMGSMFRSASVSFCSYFEGDYATRTNMTVGYTGALANWETYRNNLYDNYLNCVEVLL